MNWTTEELRFDSRKGARVFFFFSETSTRHPGYIQAPTLEVSGTRHLHLMPRVGWSCTSTPPYAFMIYTGQLYLCRWCSI